jgi:two-component system, NarL family, nitrate/nitrite response regulator NarL
VTAILVADDHPIVLEGLDALLRKFEYSVLALCVNGEEVLNALHEQQLEPDIILLDIHMPPPGGLELAHKLKQDGHPAKIVFLTSNIDDKQILAAMQLGVDGIVLKDTASQQLIAALDAVQAGHQWFDGDIVKRAVSKAQSLEKSRTATELLSPREMDVVQLVARGMRNKEIARELELTEGTVKFYMHRIYQKLNIDSRSTLATVLRDSDLL